MLTMLKIFNALLLYLNSLLKMLTLIFFSVIVKNNELEIVVNSSNFDHY